MPSSKEAADKMLALLDNSGSYPIIEAGSGWGNLLIKVSKKYPNRLIRGYELSFLPFLFSVLLKKLLKAENCEFFRKNFLTVELPECCCLLCYLQPGTMKRLSEKINKMEKADITVISNTFALPSFNPLIKKTINDIYTTPVYVYRISK